MGERGRTNAARMMTNDDLRKRIADLQDARAKRAEVTIESLIAELEEARVLASKEGQAGPMVAASMGKAKLAGLLIDRKENGASGDFAKMSADDRRRALEVPRSSNCGSFAPPRGRNIILTSAA